jgi:MFS family permease
MTDSRSHSAAELSSSSCPLSWPQQRRNLILFAVCTGTQYLAAPVLYVGITQASLCDRLGADARTSNLPGTLFFAMTAMPAFIAWLSPKVSSLKRNLSLCYATSALMLTVLAITLSLPVSHQVKVAMIILQGGVSGAVMPAAIALLWEVIGRGSDESRRGLALSMAFGAGPLLAVLGSFGQTALLGGDLFGLHFAGLVYPTNFIILFAAAIPIMGLAAFFSRFFVIAPVQKEAEREPVSSVVGLIAGLPLMFASVALMHFSSVTHEAGAALPTTAASGMIMQILGGLCACSAALSFVWHFRSLLRQRVLLLATIVTILVYAGNVIPSNMNLYSEQVLGNIPEKYAGVQNMLRFGFKVIAGTLLGWFLTRTNPRAGILATSTIFLAAQIWAILVTGPWYLIAFGLHGAGELVGVYAPNYIVSASHRNELRRNLAFVTMLMVPAAPAGYLYGSIVDFVSQSGWQVMGMNSKALGFRLSFCTCAVFILCGIILAIIKLPARPRPGMDSQDLRRT